MAYRLPPLNTLRLFEASGRHLSFKLAAEELNLTPSAVSHGIASLEDWLGVPLFVRGHRSLMLSAAGLAYLPRIREVLQQLAGATESLPGRRASRRLAVSVAPTFGLRRLIPGLPRFHARHPGIEVTIDTSHRQVDFPRDGIDAAVRMGRGDWQDLYSLCLAEEELVPVCSPDMARRIASASDLETLPLLHVMNVSEDWAAWADLAGVGGLNLGHGVKVDTIHMAFEAAAQGVGVAMGRLPLAAPDLAAGRLVPVLGPPRRCRTGYWLVAGRESLSRPEVAAFRDWIREELGTQAST